MSPVNKLVMKKNMFASRRWRFVPTLHARSRVHVWSDSHLIATKNSQCFLQKYLLLCDCLWLWSDSLHTFQCSFYSSQAQKVQQTFWDWFSWIVFMTDSPGHKDLTWNYMNSHITILNPILKQYCCCVSLICNFKPHPSYVLYVDNYHWLRNRQGNTKESSDRIPIYASVC